MCHQVLIEHFKCKDKNLSLKLLFTAIFFLILSIVFGIKIQNKNNELKKQNDRSWLLIDTLKDKNKILEKRIDLYSGYEIEKLRIRESRYAMKIEQRRIKYNLKKYKIKYDMIYPVEYPEKCYTLGSDYEYGLRANGNFHQGIDISGAGNIKAVYKGIVYKIGIHSWAGKYIILNHNINGDDIRTGYFHLSEKFVANDNETEQGKIIGFVGKTGKLNKAKDFGIHLHFGIWKKHANGLWYSENPYKNSLHKKYIENSFERAYNFIVNK